MKKKTLLNSLYPWVIFTLSSSFLFFKYLLQVSPSVMANELMRTFSLTGEALGNLAAFYFYAYLCMQLPAGLLLDHLSPKRLLVAAVAVCAFGALLFSKAEVLTVANLGRLMIGIGGAFSAVGTMKLITLWFPPNRFALVSGLMMTIGMLGAVGGEAPLSYLVSLSGWRQAMLYCGLAGFVLAVCIWLLIFEKKARYKPPSVHTETFFSDLLNIIKNPQSWLISLYSGLAFAPISAFSGLWGVSFLVETSHLHRTKVAGMISLTFIGFAIGSPLAGWLSDFIGRRKPIMIIGTLLGLLALSALVYLQISNSLMMSFLLFLFGFFTSFFFVSFAHMKEINSHHASGTAIGFINMFNAVFGALSEPLVGKLLDLGWDHKIRDGARVFSILDYHHALLTLPLAMLIALVLQLSIKETFCQPLKQLKCADNSVSSF